MKRIAVLITLVIMFAGCASDPARRAKVAEEESARLPAPSTPLSSFGQVELKPMEMGPDVARDSAKVAVAKDLDAKLQAALQGFLADWNAQRTKTAAGGRTLIIQPRVVNLRMIGGANRFFAGAFAGESSIDMYLDLKDASTGAAVGNPRIIRNSGAMAGAWSVGATDRNLLDYIADIAARYLRDHRK